jgi:hypothetical protein
MKLRHYEKVIISPAKITKYLLCLDHPDGKSKAQFFLSSGFSLKSWKELDQALRRHALDHEVTQIEPSKHGTKYIIEGKLLTPDSRSPFVQVIWIIDNGEENPRLTTAYPINPPNET